MIEKIIRFECHKCRAKLNAREEKAGKEFNCPACSARVLVPLVVEQADFGLNPEAGLIDDWWTLNRLPMYVFIALSLCLVAGSTWRSPPSPWWGAGYLSLLLIPFVSCWAILPFFPRVPRWLHTTVCGIVGVSLVVLCARTATYTQQSSSEQFDFTDTYTRSHVLIHRHARNEKMRARGPMSPSGNLHGEWEFTSFDPFDFRTVYYWYGEEVSEGEWHRLSR